MQDYILAGLVFLLFVIFLFKTQSFADQMNNCITRNKDGSKLTYGAGSTCPAGYTLTADGNNLFNCCK